MIEPISAPAGMAAAPRRTGYRPTALLLAGIALLWFALWRAGFPLPNGDDAFFSGAAIHLARTGRLVNPWIEGWMGWIPGVHPDHYFVQPPFPSYVLAGWVRCFGVSVASLTGYACAVGAAAAAAAVLLLRRRARTGIAAAALAGLVVTSYVLHRGLRPEPLGIAAWCLGTLLFTDRRPAVRWAGAAALFASCLCHLFLLTLAVPALLYPLLVRRDAATLRAWCLVVASAGLAILLLFGAAIGWEFRAFLHDLRGHARLVTPADGERLRRFFEQFIVGWSFIPNLLVVGIVAVAAARLALAAKQRALVWRSVIAYAMMLTLGIALYAPFTAMFAVLAAACACLAWTPAEGGTRVIALVPAIILVAVGLAEHTLQYAANRAAPRYDAAAVRRYVTEARPALVLFDSVSLRYVFGFQPPQLAADLDWSWSPGRSPRFWSPTALEPRDLWVVHARDNLSLRRPDPAVEPPLLFGWRRFGSVRPINTVIVVAGPSLPAPDALAPFTFRRSSSPRR